MTAIFDENNNIVSGTLNIGSGVVYDIVLSDTSGSPTIFNQNNLNTDFKIEGTGSSDVLFYDASTARLGVNTTAPDAALHVVSDCAYEGAIIESVTNCPTGVRLLLIHNSQTPPENSGYPVTIDLAGRDTNYNRVLYGQIRSQALNTDTGNTSGALVFSVDYYGYEKEIFRSTYVDTVLGGANNISGHLYDVVGYKNTISGQQFVVVGSDNTLSSNTGTVIGFGNNVNGDQVLVISNNTISDGHNNISFNVDSNISGSGSITIGSDVYSTGNENIAIGNNNVVNGDKNIGLFSNAIISGLSGIGFGNTLNANGDINLYVGNSISLSGNNSIAIGSNVNSTGNNNIIYGNNSDVSGTSIISIGVDNNPQNINSGIFIGNNISLSNSEKSVIIGLGTNTTSGLNNSVILGLNNSTVGAAPTGIVLVGQSNIVSQIKESLILGNNNNLSGNVSNNIVIGPQNNVPLTSNNNLVVGVLNNTSGITISTDGSVIGTGQKAAGDSMANTNVFGINNWVSAASGGAIMGNKTRISGSNINSVGSYVNLNKANIQNIGNSNFIIGDHNTTIGSKNDILGISSISVNTSDDRNQIFGSGNIVIGHNEVVFSGISVGIDNEIYSPDNIVYGRNNTIGYVRYPCRVSGTNVVVVGDVSQEFHGGDRVLLGLYSPASQDESVFVRTILDGTDAFGNPLGVITENIGSNYTTTLVVNSSIDSDNTIEYYVKETFDDIVHGLDPCDECFADRFAGYSSGYVVAYQDGNDDDNPAISPKYGQYSIVLGTSNTARHMSGLILGNNNHISGIKNIVIGNNITGNYNESLQIGTNNSNKIYLDDYNIVFNTGQFQDKIILHSSSDGVFSKYTMYADLYNNVVGINTIEARSTLDVSGVLTTEQLRVGLSSVSGYTLHADASGNATWQEPVTLIGQNSGLLFKTSSTIGSGMKELVFNTASGIKSLEYLRANRILSPNDSFDFITGDETEERILIINQSGIYVNDAGNDYGYNLSIKGSGIQDEVNGDNSIYLFRTLIDQNSVRMHNVTGISGQFGSMKVGGNLMLPLNLTGTALRIDPFTGQLQSDSFDKYSILFNQNNYTTSGSNALRYYPADAAITIGLTGTPPETSNNALLKGASNTFNHIILSSAPGNNTVFNNAGFGNQFIISQSGQAGTKLGFHYYTANGALGVGVSDTDLWNISPTNTNRPWWEAGKLVVDGKLRVNEIQISANGRAGGSTANRYLKTIDNAGNIGLDTLDLQYQFSGIHPLQVTTDQGDQIVTVRLATTNTNQVSLGASSNGLSIIWDGAKWAHARSVNFPQPENGSTNTDVTPGIELGSDLSLNSCRNNHVAGAGSFARGTDSFDGSSQNSRFFLRGRTGGDVDSELTSDWHKNSNTTPNAQNTISLQYTDAYDDQSPVDHKRSMVWNYTVNYSAIFSDDAGTPDFGAVGGKVEGTVLSYIASDGTRTTTKVGSDTITKRYNTVDYSVDNPVSVTIKDSGDDLNVKRLAVIANGVPNYNGMWSIVVDINQVFMPSGIVFGNSAIV